MKEFTEKDMIDFVEYYDNLPENEQIAYDFVLPDFLENRKNNDGKADVMCTPIIEEGTKVNVVCEKTKDGEVADVYFDLTLIITKQDRAILIDNSEKDWKDFVDCDTLLVQEVKARP